MIYAVEAGADAHEFAEMLFELNLTATGERYAKTVTLGSMLPGQADYALQYH